MLAPLHTSGGFTSFLPRVPSPLSPRSANIHGRPRAYAQSHLSSEPDIMEPGLEEVQKENAHTSLAAKEEERPFVPYSKRNVKKAPSPRPDELRERRRDAFLRKVRDGREEGRFGSRGEDIMRLECIRRQKAWEAELASQAPQMPCDPTERENEDDFMDGGEWPGLPMSSGNAMQTSGPSTQQPWASEEVDEVLQREDEELEALLTYMPMNDEMPWHSGEREEQQSQNLWSDDDDYDAVFSELMEQDAMVLQQEEQRAPSTAHAEEAMDMS